jgi:plastocyanin
MNARVIGILLTGALLVACSGNDAGGGAAGGESSSGTTSTITMRDDEFVPSTVTIAVGDVDLVNEGESPHNFTIEGQGVDVDVDPGTTTTRSIDPRRRHLHDLLCVPPLGWHAGQPHRRGLIAPRTSVRCFPAVPVGFTPWSSGTWFATVEWSAASTSGPFRGR